MFILNILNVGSTTVLAHIELEVRKDTVRRKDKRGFRMKVELHTRNPASTSPGQSEMNMQADIESVGEVLHRYAWALDNKDWDRLALCFHPQVDFLASNFGHFKSRDTLVAEFQRRTARVPVRRHMFSNIYVTVDGDEAVATSYLILIRERLNAAEGANFLATGYYRIVFRRSLVGWQMMHFRYENVTAEGNIRMDPSVPPVPYQQALVSYTDAPWGDPDKLSDGRSRTQQLRDLQNMLVRSADANDTDALVTCLTPDCTALIGGAEVYGAARIARILRAGEVSRITILTNQKAAVTANSGRVGAYQFQFVEDSPHPQHHGGPLFIEAVWLDGRWLITRIEDHHLWSRGIPAETDVLQNAAVASLPDRLWEWEESRETESARLEAIDALLRYTWGNDLGSRRLIRSCLSDDADGIFTLATMLAVSGGEKITDMVVEGRANLTCSFHGVLNPVIDFEYDGRSGDMRAYCFTRRTHDANGSVLLAGGAYGGHLHKEGTRWVFDQISYTRAFGPFH